MPGSSLCEALFRTAELTPGACVVERYSVYGQYGTKPCSAWCESHANSRLTLTAAGRLSSPLIAILMWTRSLPGSSAPEI